jgi:Thiamine pyrophosphate enzyme, N-terminal TPP binding domain
VFPTRRLTTAQALVAFLAAQEVERDGARWPFFAGVYGIFGHGNVAGLGEALEAMPALRYRQARNEQAMAHAATAFAASTVASPRPGFRSWISREYLWASPWPAERGRVQSPAGATGARWRKRGGSATARALRIAA